MMRLILTALCVATVLFALGPAVGNAGLLTKNVTVTYSDALGPPLSDVVTVGSGPEITFLDGSNIGGSVPFFDGILWDNEYIDIGDMSFEIGIEDYPIDLSSMYTFSGLDWGDPLAHIAGFTLTLDKVTGVVPGDVTVVSDSEVRIAFGGAEPLFTPFADVGTIRVDLQVESTVIPEPSSLIVWAIGLIGAAFVLRRRRRRNA